MKISKKSIKSLAEGILSYYVFLTKCGVSSTLSEYSLYEPLFRMLNKQKEMMISCEYPYTMKKQGKGIKKELILSSHKIMHQNLLKENKN